MTPEEFFKAMQDPQTNAKTHLAEEAGQHLLVSLVGVVMGTKHSVEAGDAVSSSQGVELLSNLIMGLDDAALRNVLILALDQLTGMIHERLTPDGSMDELHKKVIGGEAMFVGRMAKYVHPPGYADNRPPCGHPECA